MRNIIIATLLFTASSAGAEDFAAQSRATVACTSNDECIVVEGVCRDWTAINKKYEASNAETVAKMRTLAECDAVTPTAKPTAQCSENICEVK